MATTTTTVPTTTTPTIPTGNIALQVSVYDDLPSEGLELNAPCDVSDGPFAFMSNNSGVILQDPNTQETLAVARVGGGTLQRELGLDPGLPPDISELFWYCSFEGQFVDVPLDRAFYKAIVEGDTVIADGLTFDGNEIRRDRVVGLSYFFTDEEAVRANNR